MARWTDEPDHWHVATSRRGAWETFPERRDRNTALHVVRSLLLSDGQATGDQRYADAIAAIDRGYGSYRVGAAFYVAFACACPLLPSRREHQASGYGAAAFA